MKVMEGHGNGQGRRLRSRANPPPPPPLVKHMGSKAARIPTVRQ